MSLSLLLAACSNVDSDESTLPVVAEAVSVKAQFRPDIGLIPFPNDLYFAGSTDGTLNLPEIDSIPAAAALNALDGFSTNAPMNIRMTGSIDASSVVGGATAHVFEVITDPVTTATIDFVGALVPGVDYSVGTNGNDLIEFTLLKPLNPKSAYLMALTNGIMGSNGVAVEADSIYQDMKDALATGATLPDATLDQIKQLVEAHLGILDALGVTASDVLLTTSFSTQSTMDVLQAVAANASAQASSISQMFAGPGTPLTTSMVNPALPGYADVYSGSVQTEYFLSPADPFNTPWLGAGGSNLTRFNPLPEGATTLDIPALVTIPNSDSPWYQAYVAQFNMTPEEAGYQWPLVIFQHGITGDRTNAFGVVDAYAAAGVAVISIDQPLHGVTNPNNIFYQAGIERTFDIDLDGDGEIDPSGSYTINLSNLIVGRDNNRQASLDLHYLSKTAPSIDINGDGNPDFDGSQMHFLGQSLGSIVGVPFLAINNDVITATLSVPGGGIASLLRESQSFGPSLQAGLEAAGLPAALFDDYWRNAQAVIDAADPLNYASEAAANHPVLLQKVTGDTVVPNFATDKLIAAMGLPAVNTVGANPGPLGAVNFIQGGHGSLLVPVPSFAATVEMQTQAVVFVTGNPMANLPGNGQVILIQDESVVEVSP
ncbi:MAG: hypothetical protein KJO88_10125 [Gammaproteobacteria bacterium]|nr:hypothetical protein [Gammaproteobacteria bacterium]NNM14755.1 hypothetical protein [Gammaproteobacteria bacterium]